MFKSLKHKIEVEKEAENFDGESGDVLIGASLYKQDERPPESVKSKSRLEQGNFSSSDYYRVKMENERLLSQITELSNQLESANEEKKLNEDLIFRNERLKVLVNKLENDLKEKNEENKKLKEQFDKSNSEEVGLLNKRISELEESVREKNKTIRLQQQRINDIRKCFQQGILFESKAADTNNIVSSDNSSPDTSPQLKTKTLTSINRTKEQIKPSDIEAKISSGPMNDISFQYLRNVVYKFVISPNYDAQKHLVKALSVLLKFSPEEEKHVKEVLKYRISWFKSLPGLGSNIKTKKNNLSK